MYCDRRVRMSVCLSVRERIGVNAAGVAGVATPPQYLTCRGRPVLTTPNILTSVLFFFTSAELLNTARRCHFHLSGVQFLYTKFVETWICQSVSFVRHTLVLLSYNYNPRDT